MKICHKDHKITIGICCSYKDTSMMSMSMGTSRNYKMSKGISCRMMYKGRGMSYMSCMGKGMKSIEKKCMGKGSFCNKDMNKCKGNRNNLSICRKDSYKCFLNTKAQNQGEPYDFFLILTQLIRLISQQFSTISFSLHLFIIQFLNLYLSPLYIFIFLFGHFQVFNQFLEVFFFFILTIFFVLQLLFFDCTSLS